MNFILSVMLILTGFLAPFGLLVAIFGRDTAQGCLKNALALIIGIPLLIIIGVLLFFYGSSLMQLLQPFIVYAVVVFLFCGAAIIWKWIGEADEVQVIIGLTVILLPLGIYFYSLCPYLGISVFATDLLAWLCVWNPLHILG